MKNKSKNLKKGLSLALTAMMSLPTTTSAFAEKVSTPVNETNNAVKTESIPYAVLNNKELSNPVSTAKPAKDEKNVYTSFTMSVSSNAGDGSIQNPYNRFEDAIAQVANGGTIYILDNKGAFLNAQDEYGHVPFLIDKNVTIKPANGAKNAELSVRTGGIILGADVTFENITLSFANKYHDSIFANGHTLNLINVTRASGTRKIDLFAGGLHEVDNPNPIYPSGTKGVINIETNDDFGDDANLSTFGNIYAGSMNGVFNGSAEINISNNGKYKKLDLGAIKASGALEAVAGSMFDLEEPLPPAENPKDYPTKGNVSITLNNYQLSVDGTTGSDGKTDVTTSSVYPSELDLKNIDHLTVEQGNIAAVYKESNITIPNVTVKNGATLDLTKAGKEIAIENYEGDGIVTLRRDGKLTITNSMSGSMKFQTEGAFGEYSGLAAQDHTYIITPDENANISFTPHMAQTHLQLTSHELDATVEWKVEHSNADAALTPLNGLTIEPTDAKQIKRYDELNKPNDKGGMNYLVVNFPFKAVTDLDPDDYDSWVDLNDYPFEITVNGKKAEYREDEDEDGIGTHYFVEDLGLAMNFTSPNNFDEHNLIMMGYTTDYKLAAIKEGSYEIHVSHVKDDGTLAEFTSYLVVTNDVQQDDTKTGNSAVNIGRINPLKLTDTFHVPVTITHDPQVQSSEAGKAYLYVNGKKYTEKDVTPSQQSELTFDNVAVTTANNFKLGNNEILVTYSGTDTHNGSVASYSVEVGKATPTLTVNRNLESTYVYDYDGTGRELGAGIAAKANVSVGGETISNHEEKVLYKNTSISNAEFTDELPVLPGIYETKIVVFEGENYERAEVAGPTITINSVKPKVIVSGTVKDGKLTVTAQVSSVSNTIVPNGKVEFFVDGVSVNKDNLVQLVNGVATYTLDSVTGSTNTNGETMATPNVKVKYIDETTIDLDKNTSVYEETESEPIQFKVADNWMSVERVEIDPAVIELNINGKKKLDAIINPTGVSNAEVIWSIDNEQIATISEDGVVTGVAEGTAYINVMTVDGGHEATAIVKVSNTIEQPPLNGGGTGGGTNGTTPDGDGNTGGTGSAGSDSGNNGGAGSDDTDSGNNGGTGTGGSDSGNTGGTGTGGSDSGNTGGTGTGGSDSGNTSGTGSGGTGSGNNGGTGTGGSNGSTGDTGSGDSNGDNNGGTGGNGSTDSDTGNNGDTNNGADDPANPENEFKVNLEGLDEELKTKVDSLVTSITAESQKEFTLSLGGDQEDLQHVTDVVVNKDGIFITVGDEQVKVTDKLPTTDLDFTNARVLRLVDNKFLPVKHYVGGEGLRITSGNLEQIIVTSKVNEPFTDVKEDAWHHQYVEEIFNYGFTQGTTATTYSPNNAITRAEFAAMIARAFELTAKDDQVTFEDVKGKWYQDEVQALQEVGIVTGFEDGTFGGDKTITRQEAAKMLLRMLEHAKVDTTTKHSVVFADKDNISDFAKHAVDFLAEKEVFVKGEDVKFNPKNNLTRAEMAKILIRTLKLTDWY